MTLITLHDPKNTTHLFTVLTGSLSWCVAADDELAGLKSIIRMENRSFGEADRSRAPLRPGASSPGGVSLGQLIKKVLGHFQ